MAVGLYRVGVLGEKSRRARVTAIIALILLAVLAAVLGWNDRRQRRAIAKEYNRLKDRADRRAGR